jgi:predicted site-specific integrase-resolvase
MPLENPPTIFAATYTRKEFANRIKKSYSTVKRLEKAHIIKVKRTKSGSVYYTEEDVKQYFNPESN